MAEKWAGEVVDPHPTVRSWASVLALALALPSCPWIQILKHVVSKNTILGRSGFGSSSRDTSSFDAFRCHPLPDSHSSNHLLLCI